MLRTELARLVVHGFKPHSVELSFKAKMADAALEFEHLKFDTSQYRREEMIGLRGQRLRGRFAYRGILLERLMVFLHFPLFVVNCSELRLIQVGVAADPIQHFFAANLVYKALFTHEHRFFDGSQIDS